MARVLTATSAESIALKYLPPVTDGLEAWHFLNTSLEKAARNYAPGKPAASVVGLPAANENYITFKSLSNYLQGVLPEAEEETTFIVARSMDTLANDATRPMFCGTFRNPAASEPGRLSFSTSMYSSAATSIHGAAARGDAGLGYSSAGTTLTGTSIRDWGLYCLSAPATGGNTFRDLTRNLSLTSVFQGPRDRSAGLHRIGSGYQQFAGMSDMALYARYSRVLTVAEIGAIGANIRAYMATRGMVV